MSPENSPPAADSVSSSPNIPISWPPDGSLTREWIDDLTAAFEWSSRNLLPSDLPSVFPFDVLHHLVLAASNILHQEPNCVHIDPPAGDEARGGGRVVVVGDVHGQLHDVLFLLRDAGFPSEERTFVFNGDYVDRGAWGLETFLLLLAWKVYLPNRVFLLRGNHESKYCTSMYGFEKEVITKFGNLGQQVYRKCLRCFEGLPLATIIASCVYTAHGGLFRTVAVIPSKRLKGKKGRKLRSPTGRASLKLGSLEELSRARRTVLDPPLEGLNLIPGDVLWSDPSSSMGLSPNKERGIGLLWGPDCSEYFLSKYQLKLIIRSHEGPDARDKRHDMKGIQDGYAIDHEATDVRYKNRGAYIVLQPPDFATPEFHTFEAVKPRPEVNPYYDFKEVIDSDEELDFESMDHSSVAST
ncbi:serine/threonine-protein phosphatase 7 isoform X2 [Phalaenopsis equestris]|uniref:serine/threonine-protein phosphatase 7 isoform X2 n=1 Tax=Phalaenopsis equestris TaxID=78828 RepID=UPI0009E32B9B|nr:serine/threonine-protein phosphatase 7 isoform X2 [Phalaenopsis equestris]